MKKPGLCPPLARATPQVENNWHQRQLFSQQMALWQIQAVPSCLLEKLRYGLGAGFQHLISLKRFLNAAGSPPFLLKRGTAGEHLAEPKLPSKGNTMQYFLSWFLALYILFSFPFSFKWPSTGHICYILKDHSSYNHFSSALNTISPAGRIRVRRIWVAGKCTPAPLETLRCLRSPHTYLLLLTIENWTCGTGEQWTEVQ